MQVYLSGAIEYSPDHGKRWRAEITPFLRGLGHEVYDPAEDEKKNLSDEERQGFRAWKHTDLPRFQQTIRKIIAYDLDWIEQRTDYIVAYWDEHASKGAGSQAELAFAHRRGIPVYLVTELPVGRISGWILGCATEVFASFDELKRHLAVRYSREEGHLAEAKERLPAEIA
jgi:nucleoside 2-deoxyribosyltransferase